MEAPSVQYNQTVPVKKRHHKHGTRIILCQETIVMPKQKRLTIRRITIQKLFGLYDYEIPPQPGAKQFDTLCILYGDNGSGKTTILRLMFHLLASEPRAGHRSFLAGVKFRHLKIELNDGTEISASREGDALTGSFETSLRRNGQPVSGVKWRVDPDGRIRSHTPSEDRHQQEFLSSVGALNLSLFLLSDDRSVHITSPEAGERFSHRRGIERENEPEYYEVPFPAPERRARIDPEEVTLHLLELSIERAVDSLRHGVMRGSSRGESDVNTIYADIIKRIASAPPIGRPEKGLSREELCAKVANLEKRNKRFAAFGLASPFEGKGLTDQVLQAKGSQLTLIRRILVPYLDALEAKLNAVDDVQNRIETLVTIINSFLVDKEVRFRIEEGFTIISRSAEKLRPRMLSSGERHLFLLFCNTIVALATPSIFIIDEPEISLNVKWQRNLISSLLECAKASPIQYFFASHSVELIAQHRENVVKLEHKPD
jgi:energy-coupling factor transporter ATP-binding protein EcfA2